ncbi:MULTISPECIES: hypothetical protein [unclassified Streptomyces]|uniref:hypothetical protein n=1 Tax=unclassified Streptomyces TaxID=2593676 RepID=UPI00136C70CC|nr:MULTISPECIES: hypothetical protein [unclassified Streptomyces]NEA02872.1 hypothetical protein [Streptomyces sp. SID10116]MYY83206.1 hypothetical protein [Streptomyces sp. SID335]MYZ11787.1 hypothetical protein [Streptomyces sp. SID337]NDZ85842.1 hypothetical protein [Streptomyces sp. SID10115]NEB45735.1 hypothetical protein [Streptomyces sp. SID339]
MTRTTPPRPVDVEAQFPELSSYRKTCTRLHPRPGAPKPTESSIGGPFLWPANEPWPTCREPHTRDRGRRVEDVHQERRILQDAWRRHPQTGPTPEDLAALSALEQEHCVPGLGDNDPIPLLPLAQLFTKDVAGLTPPDGCDLLQVLWCPFDAHGTPRTPGVHLRWRNSAECDEALETAPVPEVVGSEGYVPEPCTVAPEQVTEHEFQELLSEGLRYRIAEWEAELEELADESGNEEEFITYHHDLSIAPGWKVGGYASWAVTGPYEDTCPCGAPMRLLLTIASHEWDGGSHSWVPLEDRDLIATSDANIPTRVTVGRGGSLNVFVCAVNASHAHKLSLQ